MNSPYEACPPDEIQKTVTIKARIVDDEKGIWEIWCPEWKCTLHDKNLTRAVAQITASIETNNEEVTQEELSWWKNHKQLLETAFNRVDHDKRQAELRKAKRKRLSDIQTKTPRVSLWQAPT